MQDSADIVQNIERVYDSNTAFQVLKDFERVIDELDVYVYENWEDGELPGLKYLDILLPAHLCGIAIECLILWVVKDY